jgi:hypothetical protein
MKKIIICATISPSDSAITVEAVKKTLGFLGNTHFFQASEVNFKAAPKSHAARAVWLYAPYDDSEPFRTVSGPGEHDGPSVKKKELTAIREHGVCVEMRATHPRADKYGAPLYAADDVLAAGLVADHGFAVDEGEFEVYVEDRGDDGGEELWFKLVLPR